MKRQRTPTHPASGEPRPPRRIHEEPAGKLPDVAGCPRCGISYRNGRWSAKQAPTGAYEHVCPACTRVASDDPAGVLHVGGAFVGEHRDELVALLRHVEERERKRHPLKRIMAIQDEDGGFVVTATDAKLVESFGRALHKAYEGTLEHPPTQAEPERFVRARWTRD